MNLSARTKTLILHDLGVFLAALVTALLAVQGPVGWDVLIAAVATAVKVTLRQVLPVPPKA